MPVRRGRPRSRCPTCGEGGPAPVAWTTHQYERGGDEGEGGYSGPGAAHGVNDGPELILLFGADDSPVVLEDRRRKIGF